MNKFSPRTFGCCLLWLVLLTACAQVEQTQEHKAIFRTLSPEETGIEFNNKLTVTRRMNFFEYGYFYLGGGVAIGDFNNDNLQDIYFTGNMVANRMYLNSGGLQFVDITMEAGVAADDRWITGCSVIDINLDGWDDIYVSVAGKWKSRENILYINKGLNQDGIPAFEDVAADYGLDDAGNSIQSTFLDFDNDGDIDVFVANYPETRFNLKTRDYKRRLENVTIEESGHLYRNNGDNTFSDVTEDAGLMRFGLTLGVIANDFNYDGFTDLYLSNDFHCPDYFYLNNGDGSFREVSHESMRHTSFYGMGIDAADYNNDGLLDLMQLDMAPADNYRTKANMASMDPNMFWNMVRAGFHNQYMYNALQTAMGIRSNGIPFYAETAKMSGLEVTDWSWASLFADLDNDGYKDIFVTNGIRKDINNKDYFNWLVELEKGNAVSRVKYDGLSLPQLIDRMPSKKLDNPVFRNVDGHGFEVTNKAWGLHFEGFSNGAAYADLDNDGDLELITNNVDSTATIYQNLSSENSANGYLSVQLIGPDENPMGLGTKITLECGGITQYQEHTMVRGFQSSVDHTLHFGIGKSDLIDELRISWPDGSTQILKNVSANQLIEIDYAHSGGSTSSSVTSAPIFRQLGPGESLEFVHRENAFNDFDREVLLPHKMSAFGPALAIGDVDDNGIDDLFVGGAKDQSSCLFLGKSDRAGYKSCSPLAGAASEDVDALFFDADGDGDLDLYVATGGNEHEKGSTYYRDRIYENDGQGNFSLLTNCLPDDRISGSVVVHNDIDGDGDQDLFVGGRQVPGEYPRPASSVILVNESSPGNITFRTVEQDNAPVLSELGMVTDAIWDDFDSDSDPDLIVVGEWMPITLIENQNGTFEHCHVEEFATQSTGWWNSIEKGDFDGDGDHDYVLGNLGLNYKYKATQNESFDIYARDFDANGKLDIVLGYYQNGIQFPVRGKQCSSEQIPGLKERYDSYSEFASADLIEIYSSDALETSIHYQANEFAHVYVENHGDRTFSVRRMPQETQIGTVNEMIVVDFNNDEHLDVVMGGNLLNAEVETPRSDACFGWLLLGDGHGNFEYQDYSASGLYVPHETRAIGLLNANDSRAIVFGNNNSPLIMYVINEKIEL